MESNIKKQAEPQKAHEAICSDIEIKRWLKTKLELISYSIPNYIMTPDGTLSQIYDSITQKRLDYIDEQIEFRKQKILSFYNCLLP